MAPAFAHKPKEPACTEDACASSTATEAIDRCLSHLSPEHRQHIHIEPKDLLPSWYQIDGTSPTNAQVLGCRHYKVACKFMASCCRKWHPCRFCHDDAADHELNRYATQFCLCMHCSTAQPASNRCINPACAKALSAYYCDTCKFWDNDDSKKIFHCEKCNVCRLGERSHYTHCDKCNACLHNDYHSTHKCIERSLECDCPICGEFLFTTILPIMFMPCGHAIHFFCHRDHLQTSYQCPICLKSVLDMTQFFNQVDLMLAGHEMPAEYANLQSLVLCNDCEMKSLVKFHFLYHKCNYCKSYNTKILQTLNQDDAAEADGQSDNTASTS